MPSNTGYTKGTARAIRSLSAAKGTKAGKAFAAGEGGMRKAIAAGIRKRTGLTGAVVKKRATRQAHALRETRRAQS